MYKKRKKQASKLMFFILNFKPFLSSVLLSGDEKLNNVIGRIREKNNEAENV